MKQKLTNFISIPLLIVQLGLAVATIFAFIEDSYRIISLICLVPMIILPYLWSSKKDAFSLLTFSTLFFAFIPSFNPSFWEGRFEGTMEFVFSKIVVLRSLSLISKELIILIVVMACLLVAEGIRLKRSHWIFVAFACLSLLVALFLPAMTDFFTYVASYLFIVVAYYLLDKLTQSYTAKYEDIFLKILLLIIYFKGMYELLLLINAYAI